MPHDIFALSVLREGAREQGAVLAALARPQTNSRRLVCRERSIVTGDGGRFTTPPPSRLEARSRLSKHSCSFDHLVGAGEEGRRDFEAEPFCGPAVNYEFKPWSVARPGAH